MGRSHPPVAPLKIQIRLLVLLIVPITHGTARPRQGPTTRPHATIVLARHDRLAVVHGVADDSAAATAVESASETSGNNAKFVRTAAGTHVAHRRITRLDRGGILP